MRAASTKQLVLQIFILLICEIKETLPSPAFSVCRIQKSCVGTWESQEMLCLHWRGTFPRTSASTLTWTRKCALFATFATGYFLLNVWIRRVTFLMIDDFSCTCVFELFFRSGRYLLSGDTEGLMSVWDTHTVPPDGNEELLQPLLRFRAHWDCTNGIR